MVDVCLRDGRCALVAGLGGVSWLCGWIVASFVSCAVAII